MKYYALLLFSFILFTSSDLSAQTVEDAVRYSNLNVGGTARVVGVGGAFGALGADFGAISINPAGLGMYRSSELVLTPSFVTVKSNAQLLGAGTTSDRKNNFNLNNVGIVFHNEGKRKKWVSNALAIGYNKLANFHNNITFEGETIGSFTDRFVEQAFLFGVDDLSAFESFLAFDAGALYRVDPNDNATWTSDYELNGGDDLLFKKQAIERTGSINEMVLSFGANYNHRLMFGATVGLPFISYDETKIYEEEDLNDEIEFFDEFRFEETLAVSGIGINIKLGMIYRLSQMFRVGLSLHSPTRMALNEAFSSSLRYDFTTPDLSGGIASDSPEGSFDYGLSTPWRAVISGAAIIGKVGFITADVEYVDYSYANFDFTSDSNSEELRAFETELNGDINNQLKSTVNIRIGGEYALKQFRLRAGYSNAGNYRAISDLGGLNSISAGLGYRGDYFYADMAFQRSTSSTNYVPYLLQNPEDGQSVVNEANKSKIMLTIGFKF